MKNETSQSVYLYELHKIYQTWLNELALASDELAYFKLNLEKIVVANTKVEVTSRVEQFQNKFIAHLNELQELKHAVNEAEKKIEENIKSNLVAVDHRKEEMNPQLQERMQQFQKLFAELKTEYNQFLAKTF